MSYVKSIVKWPMGKEGQERVDEGADYVKQKVPLEEVEGGAKRLLEEEKTYVMDDHGIGEAEKANRGDNASMFVPSPLLPFLPSRIFFNPSRKHHAGAFQVKLTGISFLLQASGPNSPSPTPSTNPSSSSAFP